MEIIVTIAYVFLVRLIFFDYKLLTFNLFWKFVVFGLYTAAALTELTMLGQYTPYSKDMFVQRFVVQLAPELGGEVIAIHVVPNEPVKKGTPLLQMDPRREQNDVKQHEAELAQAKSRVLELKANYEAAGHAVASAQRQLQESEAGLQTAMANVTMTEAQVTFAREQLRIEDATYRKGAGSELRLDGAKRSHAVALAQLETAKAGVVEAQLAATDEAPVSEAKANEAAARAAYESLIDGEHTQVRIAESKLANARVALENRTVRAPSDGYVVNLQIAVGAVVRLKTPVLTFVSTEEYWLVSRHIQQGIQHVQPGDDAEVAFEMYPGQVFPAEVVAVAWATGRAQGLVTGVLEQEVQTVSRIEDDFWVRLRLKTPDPERPVRFGANGIAAIYTKASPDVFVFLRRIEVQSESFLFYLFNPF